METRGFPFIFSGEKGIIMANITGADICSLILENGLENAKFWAECNYIYTINEDEKTVTMIHLHTQKCNVWPGADKWPDDFDDLSDDEQQEIIDEFEDVLDIWRDNEEEFQQVQTVPLSMFSCFVQV